MKEGAIEIDGLSLGGDEGENDGISDGALVVEGLSLGLYEGEVDVEVDVEGLLECTTDGITDNDGVDDDTSLGFEDR